MREIINKHQVAILQVLEGTVDAKHSDITEKTGISVKTYQPAMADLRERDLVRGTKVGSKHIVRLSITMAGIRALHDHIEHQHQLANSLSKVPPQRINLFSLPVYVPKKQTFCRNDGNRHIRSLGAFA